MKTRLSYDELWPGRFPNSFVRRMMQTCRYLETQDIAGRLVADCGEDNPMRKAVELTLCTPINTLDWDFDNEMFLYPQRKYDVILCLEVLEHLFNPLLFLNSLKMHLKPGGLIYLSTPRQWPQLLKAKHHFHEIPTDRLMWLFDAAGLKVIETKKITIAGWWYNHLYGIRPVLRYFQKTRMFKLKVAF